jgi:hypothetical protein
VQQNRGCARINVHRTDGFIGAVEVNFSVSGGTRSPASSSYFPGSGTLTFVDGERTNYFNIRLIDNNTYGRSHTLEFLLSNAQGGSPRRC